MDDFLNFRKMLTPVIIRILFWIGVAISVLVGLGGILKGIGSDYGGGAMVFMGLLWLLIGPVIVRVYCELLIVIFSINDTLTDIRNDLRSKDQG